MRSLVTRCILVVALCIGFPLLAVCIEIHEIEAKHVHRQHIVRQKDKKAFVHVYKSADSWLYTKDDLNIELDYKFENNKGNVLVLVLSDEIDQHPTGIYYYFFNNNMRLKRHFIDFEESALQTKLAPIGEDMKYTWVDIFIAPKSIAEVNLAGRRIFTNQENIVVFE